MSVTRLVLALWLPMPVALAFLPTLRTMGEQRISGAPSRPTGKAA